MVSGAEVEKGSLRSDVDRLLAREAPVLRDPYPVYKRLREEAPVFRYDHNTIIVSTHAELRAIYRDKSGFQNSELNDFAFEDRLSLLSNEDVALYRDWMGLERTRLTRLNGDQHRRVRSAAQRAFTPRRIAGMRESVELLVERLLDELGEEQSPDFITFADGLPLTVILDMMGAPHEDGPMLKRWCDALVVGQNPLRPEAVRAASAAEHDLHAYIRELIRFQRRLTDRTTIVADLLDASAGDQVTEAELTSLYAILLFAGHETTRNMFCNGLVALLKFPDQWRVLCSDPALVASVVEEVLRYDSPVQFERRVSHVQREFHGVGITPGMVVLLAMGAANRDPKAFDQPDVLNIRRRPNDHLAFNHGVHFCLGAGVARLEGELGFRALISRYPNIQLAVDPTKLEYHPYFQQRALKGLPIELGTRTGSA